jgi:8-oxo-dGTP diphosphatase
MFFSTAFLIPIVNNRIYLGVKRYGSHQGRLTLYGGKVEAGESPDQAVVREMYEESGILLDEVPRFAGHITYTMPDGTIFDAFMYTTDQLPAEPAMSDEMAPESVPMSAIPYSRMWDDNQFWFPCLLTGRPFEASFVFDEQDRVVHMNVAATKNEVIHSVPNSVWKHEGDICRNTQCDSRDELTSS